MSTITIVNHKENLNNASAGSYKQLADKAMFKKLKSGDKEAWSKAFEWVFCRFYHRAFIMSRKRCYDDITAEQMAVDALCDAFFEIDEKVKKDQVEWRGEKAFSSYVWQRISWILLGEHRKWLKQQMESIFTPIGEDDGEEIFLIDSIPDSALTPEELVQLRERIGFILELVLTLRDDKLNDKPKLKETVSGIIQYVEMKLAESVVEHPNPESLSLNDLIDLFNPTAFQPKKREMYNYLVEKLGITRDVLHQRMNDIRKIVRREHPEFF